MMTPDERERSNSHRWQMLAARVLVDLETEAATAGLPVLHWTVSNAKLIGRPLPFRSAEETRMDWTGWVDHLEAEPMEGTWTSLSTGAELLQATTDRSPGRGHIDVTVLLLAEIPTEDED